MLDEIKIIIKAGDGGDGAVSFRHEKFVPKGGPDGGDGGKGADVFLKTTTDLNNLLQYRYKKHFEAENGGRGGNKNKRGKNGEDLYLSVPMGTQVTIQDCKNTHNIQKFDLKEKDQVILLAQGGHGGKGNARFRTSTNQTPLQFQPGIKGEEKDIYLELKLLADIGLIGFPNVGKSTLISKLTRATPKIADYPFTTLEPNLGVMENGLVLADIPGLISGASVGKGLGHQFLRHIERTKILTHVIAPISEEQSGLFEYLLSSLETTNKELKIYSDMKAKKEDVGNNILELPKGDVIAKKQLVILNKSDLLKSDELKEIISKFRKKRIKVLSVSCKTGEGLDILKKEIQKATKTKSKSSI